MWKRKTIPQTTSLSEGSLPGFFLRWTVPSAKVAASAKGYQRGVGLEFGDLRRLVEQDPDYQDAIGLADGRTIVSGDRLKNLFLLIKFYAQSWPRAHCGIWLIQRRIGVFMAVLAKKFLPAARVFALNTYDGMPETNNSIDAHASGDFVGQPLDELLKLERKFSLDNMNL